MKRMICFLCLIFLMPMLPSCGNAFHDAIFHDEAFRARNAILFPNDTCEHMEAYTAMSDPWDADVYHMRRCKFGNCDYVAEKEPHTFVFTDTTVRGPVNHKENGYLYHSFGMYCRDCNAWVMLSVLCRTQDTGCGKMQGEDGVVYQSTAQCMIGADFSEIFRDTPYRIVIKENT